MDAVGPHDPDLEARKQCAWCGFTINAPGRPIGKARPLEDGVSHGMCEICRRARAAGPGSRLERMHRRAAAVRDYSREMAKLSREWMAVAAAVRRAARELRGR